MSGDYSGEATPVPISNTEVKLSSADGSRGFASARVGRCQIQFVKKREDLVNKLNSPVFPF